MRKFIFRTGIFVMAVFMSCIFVSAEEAVRIMKVKENENPVIFVKGIAEEIEVASAIVGNLNAEGVNYEGTSEQSVTLKTLILLDNSLSIPEKKRERVKEVVEELLAGRSDNEQFALATFGENMEILIDFTDDYISLKETLNKIEFVDRETYLTDVLYEIVDGNLLEDKENNEFSRIFVISDGVDNKSLGYTTEELNTLLMERSIPVYSVGVYNRSSSNTEELKNMFAISRQTKGESFLLDEVEDVITIVSKLAEDRKITVFTVFPKEESKDGSEKTILLKIVAGGNEMEVQADDVRMIQTVKEEPTEEKPKEEPVQPIVVEEVVVEKEEKPDIMKWLLPAAAAVLAAVCVIAIIIFIVHKNKKKKAVVEIEDPFSNTGNGNESKTEIISGNTYEKDKGETIQLFETNTGYYVKLTDVSNPSRSFKKSINDRLVIGRSSAKSDICIDYDQSVSSAHCAIERRGNRFYLIDLQSKNKTYLNDNQVLSEVEIYSGSVIKLGRVQLNVEMS